MSGQIPYDISIGNSHMVRVGIYDLVCAYKDKITPHPLENS